MPQFDKPYYYDNIEDNILLVYREGTHYHNIFHNHNGYEIYFFVEGNVDLLIGHSCFHLEPRSIAIIEPNEYHLANCLDDSMYKRITLNLTPQVLRQLSTDRTDFINFFERRENNVNNIIKPDEDVYNELLSLLSKLNESLNSDDFGSDIMAHSHLLHILYLICNNYIASNSISPDIMPPVVSGTIRYVDKHISEDFDLEDIQKEIGFNSRYLSRQFKKYTGISLKSYILEKKINLAKMYLANGESVTYACFNSGFNDYSNFIRTFKQYTGITPGSFKQKND